MLQDGNLFQTGFCLADSGVLLLSAKDARSLEKIADILEPLLLLSSKKDSFQFWSSELTCKL